jgi:hypothetical protein
VPAGSRAPLRDWPPASRSDRSTAPPTGRRCGPAVSPFNSGAAPRPAGPLHWRSLCLLVPLLLRLAASSLVQASATPMTTTLHTGLQ